MKDQILDFFFPKRCLGCGKVGFFVCERCEQKIPFLEVQYCAVCQRPSLGGFTHHRCRGLYRPDRLISLFHYKDLGRDLVTNLKYQRVFALAPILAGGAGDYLDELGIDLGADALITFVPVHPIKLLERGFNQSEVVAWEFAKRKGLASLPLLCKVKETVSQTKLKKQERALNVEGSFTLDSKFSKEIVGRDVLLIDDVYTTGATVLECGRILKKAGARFLYVLTLARD